MSAEPRPEVGRRRALQVGLVSVVTLVAFESLAVITILPDIEADLGGIAWYGWVTTAFFLGTMIGIVFAGDQADRRGAGRPYVGRSRAVRGRARSSAGWPRRCPSWSPAGSCRASAPAWSRRSATWRSAGPSPGRAAADVRHPVDGVGRPRARRAGARRAGLRAVGWRWVFLGLVPLVAVAGTMVVPAMLRIGPVARDGPAPTVTLMRHRLVEAARVAAGAALVIASFTASAGCSSPGCRPGCSSASVRWPG